MSPQISPETSLVPSPITNTLDTYRPCLPTRAQERDLVTFTTKIADLRLRLTANAEGDDHYQANTRELRRCELALQDLRRRIEAPNADVPTYLRMARVVAGLSQYQLALCLRCSESVIGNHERGRYDLTLDHHYLLARRIAAICAYTIENPAAAPAMGYNDLMLAPTPPSVVISEIPFPVL